MGFTKTNVTKTNVTFRRAVPACCSSLCATAPGRAASSTGLLQGTPIPVPACCPCLLSPLLSSDNNLSLPDHFRIFSSSSPLQTPPSLQTRVLGLFWNFRDGKCVGSRSRKSLGKLQNCLSEKLKSSPGEDSIYSISPVLFPSLSVNPHFHTNLLFAFVAGDLVWSYLSYILCVIIFQLQIIAGRHGHALASLFITLCARQSIVPDGAGVSQGQLHDLLPCLQSLV